MAGFKTHVSFSTLLGAGYGAAAHLGHDVALPSCVLAGGLCSLSGMLPDLDSDSGVPVRETMAFTAAVVPMLMLDRFHQLRMSNESIVLAGGVVYFAIRFGVGWILKRFTVHRGMWHSLPAVAIAGLLAFLICACDDVPLRLFNTGAVMLGYASHLVLDELYSIQWRRGRLRIKKSFGSALKLWSKSPWATISTYAKLAMLAALATGDPVLMQRWGPPRHHVPRTADSSIEQNPRDDRALRR